MIQMIPAEVFLFHTVTGDVFAALDRFYTIPYSKRQGPTEFTVNTTLADTNVTLRDLVALRVSAVVLADGNPVLAGVLKPYGVAQAPEGDLDLTLTFSSPEVLFEQRLVLPYPYLPLLDQWGAPVNPQRGFSVTSKSYLSAISEVYAHAMSIPQGGFPAVLPSSATGPVTRYWDPVDAHSVQDVVDSLAEEGGVFYRWEPEYSAVNSRVTWNLTDGHRVQDEPHVISGSPDIPSIVNLTVDQDASSVYSATFFMGGQIKDELALGYFTQSLDPLTPVQEMWDSSNSDEMDSTALTKLAHAAATSKPQATWTGTLLDDITQRDIRIGDQVILNLTHTSNFPGYVSAPLTCVAIEGEVGVQATKITLKGDYDV